MRLKTVIIFMFALPGLLLWLGTGLSLARARPPGQNDVVQNDIIVDYPNKATFRLQVDTDSPLASAQLTYDIEQFTCLEVSTQVPVEIEGGAAQVVEWTWVMSRSGNPPPGARLWWEWTVTDTSGRTITTPRQTYTFSDDRFNWRTVETEEIRLHWYRGNDVGLTLLEAAVDGLDSLQNDMGIELQSQVQFFIYGSAEEMREAILYIQDWAGGVAFSDYNIILMGVSPQIADTWGRRTIRHELAHLVVGQFGQSCVGGHRPTWLEEGLAMYVEGEPDETTRDDLDRAGRNNAFVPLRSLNGPFPTHDSNASLAYSQSYSVVDFLLREFGQEKLQALLLQLSEGEGYDEALEQVYGFNVDGLELAWRADQGLPERSIPPTPTPLVAANIPTVVPMAAPRSLPTPTAAASSPPAPVEPSSGLCGLGLIPLLVVGVVVGKNRHRRRVFMGENL